MPIFQEELPPISSIDSEDDPKSFYEMDLLEWCEDRYKVGQAFVEQSPGYEQISESLDYVFSMERGKKAKYAPPRTSGNAVSTTSVNLISGLSDDIVAKLTDSKMFWEYATRNPKYTKTTRLANASAEDWYETNNIGLVLGDLARYHTFAGTGFAHMFYSRRTGNQMMEAEDPRNLLPIEPGTYHSVQDCLGLIHRRWRTPTWVWLTYKQKVRPDVSGSGAFGWFLRAANTVREKLGGPLTKRGNMEDAPAGMPGVCVNSMYLSDYRINEEKKTRYMGEWKDKDTPMNGWSYKVEYGMPMYPFKRLIVWSTNKKLYDGPSPYWHGMYPFIKMTLNPWPNNWLGKAPLWDCIPLNRSINGLCRVIDDHAAQVANPGTVADRNVSKSDMNKFDSRIPGYKLRTNFASGKGIQVVNPPPLDDIIWKTLGWTEEKMRQMAEVADISQMADLNQIPSGDTIDTIMKAMTPGNRLKSRRMEGFMKEVAKMYFINMCQFDTISKRITHFGANGLTKEDFDYQPGSIVPDDMPDGSPGDIANAFDTATFGSPRPVYERVRIMGDIISMTFKSGSMLNSARQEEVMFDLMFAKMGYLSMFTLMEKAGRYNIVPAGMVIPESEIERLALQQSLGIGMIANAQGRKATDQTAPTQGQNAAGPTIQTS